MVPIKEAWSQRLCGDRIWAPAYVFHDGHIYEKEYCELVSYGYKILAEAIEADLAYEIPCPALLICGEKDKAGYTKRYNKAWSERSGLPIRWIPGAGHNSNTDNPELVNCAIREFLGTILRLNPNE